MALCSPIWASRNANESNNQLVTKWLFFVALLVAIMVVIGGITRLTGSGLSMVEWRPLIGTLPPMTASEWQRVYELYQASPEYQKLNYGMSLNSFKTIFFWEYVHRLWGRLLGLAFGLPFLFLVLAGRIPAGLLSRMLLLFLLGGFQGVVGWWMVKSGLTEEASVSQYRLATHLSIALVIFSILIWTVFDLRDGYSKRPTGIALASLILLVITVIAGALVAGMDAGLLYNEYPLMGSYLLPVEYGEAGWLDPFENPASAQFHHRWLAALTFTVVIVLGLKTRGGALSFRANLVLAAVSAQFAIGVLTLIHGVPVALGGMHQAGAVILLGFLLALLHGTSRPAQPTIKLTS
ncbi:COX15/CtaA family protein [Candidatus Puniceispirillum sp.]|nr:COX15/CtaA family protein [Candidatus Puniceispirillum sp.]